MDIFYVVVLVSFLVTLSYAQGPCPTNANETLGCWCGDQSPPTVNCNSNLQCTCSCSSGARAFSCDRNLSPRQGTIGVNRFGGDLNGMPLSGIATPGICYQRCTQTPGCVAWAFDYCIDSSIQCWLKGSVPATSLRSCAVSGVYVPTIAPSPPPAPPTPSSISPPPPAPVPMGSSCACSCCLGNGCVVSYVGNAGFTCDSCDNTCRNSYSQCPSISSPGQVISFCSNGATSSGGNNDTKKKNPLSTPIIIGITIGGVFVLVAIALSITAILLGWHKPLLAKITGKKEGNDDYELRM